MLFSYNWLQSYFKKPLPAPEKLADILTLHLAEVEGIGNPPAGGEKDFILDIDIRPNRAGDCLSHSGVAREISAIANYKLLPANSKLLEDKTLKSKDFIAVEVKNKNACSRYTARVITNVKVFPSPKWIQEKLKACGLRPINNIVDATNYVMLETGQPLHAFDFEKIEGSNPKSIIVRFGKKGEKITTLDQETYDLDENILTIADSKDPLAIAGIKGGKKAEIGLKTKTIILESANFDSRVVRLGSKEIDLKTDASLRFEHGLDPNLTEIAINKAANLIKQVSGGKIAQGIVDYYPQKVLPKTIKLDLNYVKSLLGLEIPEKKIRKILERLGFKVANLKNILNVLVPTSRIDISLPEDLVEEVGRVYGYEKIPAALPRVSLTVPEKNTNELWENISKDVLRGAGFAEVWNYSFVSDKDLEIFKFYGKDIVQVSNSLSFDYQYLRPSLIPNLLKNIEKNQKNFEEIKIFELGKIFSRDSLNIIENRMITGAMTGNKFYEAKGVVDVLLDKLGIKNISYEENILEEAEEARISIWYPQRSAKIMTETDGKKSLLGVLGEIAPRVSGNLKIEKKVMVFDIDFEGISALALQEKEYVAILKYPSALRDVAVLVPVSVKAKEVLGKIHLAAGDLIYNIDLFDIYEGNNLPEGKKNLAFHIAFQAQDRTLAPTEIDDLQNKIIKALEENKDWEVRR